MKCMAAIGFLLWLSASNAHATDIAQCDADNDTLIPVSVGLAPWLSGGVADAWARKVSPHFRQSACLVATIRSDKDYVSYLRSAAAGKYDLLDAPPHVALYLVQHHGFDVIAADSRDSGHVVFFVRPDAEIETIRQLDGKTIALPDPLGFVSLVAEQALRDASVITHFIYPGKHDRVITAVTAEEAEAGVVFSPILDSYHERGHQPLRLLLALVPHQGMMVARRGLTPELRKRALHALLSFVPGQSALLPAWEAVTSEQVTTWQHEFAPYVSLLEQRLSSHTLSLPLP